MAKYWVTYACGHEGRVSITGPSKMREWKLDKISEGDCPECYQEYLKIKREQDNAEALKKSKEMELVDLEGTGGQIPWANTIRQGFIDKAEVILNETKSESIKEKYIAALDYLLENKTKASWFIDNRYESILDLLVKIYKEIPTDEDIIKRQTELEMKAKCTVMPENTSTNLVAEIIIKDDEVAVKFERNDRFITVVKSLGYEWKGKWKREISETTGTAKDRAAELGNKLLNAGFPIMIFGDKVRNNAIQGVFEPECKRWIYIRGYGQYKDWFAIKWANRDSNLYNRSRSLPGSKYDSGSVMVRINHYKEVQEFADLYGFKFTSKSKNTIEEFIKYENSIKKVDPAEIETINDTDGLKDILNSSDDILEHLKDD